MKRLVQALLVGSGLLLVACGDGAGPGAGAGGDGGAGEGGAGVGAGTPGVRCEGSGLICPEGTRCQLDGRGVGASCVVQCEGPSACGDATCCGPGASCVSGSCKAADLVIEPLAGAEAVSFATVTVDDTACEVLHGCVGGSGRRSLVRFGVALANAGDAPLVLGEPGKSGVFAPNFCEDSYVVPGFFRARLKRGDTILKEAKLDARCIATSGGAYSCEAQGLGPGDRVEQPGTASCNAIDVTGVEAGLYDLEITVNPGKAIAESNFDNNTVVIPVDYPACDGVMCGGACCPQGYACEGDVCLVPDLRPNGERVAETVQFSYQTFAADSCEVFEGCIAGPGRRHLLQFEGRIENAGPGHLNPGPEEDNPLFEYAMCHAHYHFKEFTDYRLVDTSGEVIAQGHKQSFCLLDMAPLDPSSPAPNGAPPSDSRGCSFLSAGWADIYGVGTPCQWVDVTDVPEGDYILRVAVNPTGNIPEVSSSNNVVEIPVHVPAYEPCVPEPEICGDWIDQDCDGVPDDDCTGCSFPLPEVCGDGVDQDCNDIPDDGCVPIAGADSCATPGELATSMTYTAEITAENTPDVSLPCGGAGGEVFFRFSLPAEEVVYLSTLASDMNAVLAVLPGAGCDGAPTACAADTCGGFARGANWAGRLAAGDYTVVVKAADAGATGLVRLKFERASCLGEGAAMLDSVGLTTGDTTGAPMPLASTCGAVSPQDSYFVALCPGKALAVSACGLTSFPMALKAATNACRPTDAVCSEDVFSGCSGDPEGASVTLYSWDPAGSLGGITVGGRTPIDFGPYQLFTTY